jgi:hypothetical protein
MGEGRERWLPSSRRDRRRQVMLDAVEPAFDLASIPT